MAFMNEKVKAVNILIRFKETSSRTVGKLLSRLMKRKREEEEEALP